MCKYIMPFDTNVKFIILMHPKEFKKTKNNTGRFTHLLLKNSKLFIGDDFTNHKAVNKIIREYDSYLLYPSSDALNLSSTKPVLSKKMAIFIVDSTWSCSVSLLKKSKNLHQLKSISFNSTKKSRYKIKQQPEDNYLSTIESTYTLLEELNHHNIENIEKKYMDNFLEPFNKMVEYQVKCSKLQNSARFKSYI